MFCSNDVQDRHWDNGDLNFPPSKSQRRTVMTSDFVDSVSGFLEYKDSVWNELKVLIICHFGHFFLPNLYQETEEIKQEIQTLGKGIKGESRARRAGSILDITTDGYYTVNSCLPDFEKVGQSDCGIKLLTCFGFQAVKIFKLNNGADKTPIFTTDWSPIHG